MRIRIPLLVLALVLLAGVALAEPPPPPSNTEQNLLYTFFDLSRWIQNISNDIAKLEGGVSNLALALILLGFVYGIVQGIVGGGLEAIKGAFVRLAVVALLFSLWNSGFVRNTLEGAMTAAREASTDSAADTLSEAANNLDALALRIVPFMGALGAIKIISADAVEQAIKTKTRTVAQGMSAGSTRVLQYLNWATLLLIPMMLFFFIIIVVASFTVMVGVALFPLAAALLIFPRGAAVDWFGKWVAAVMGALLLVILMPIGFKAAVDMGINRPVYQVNAYVDAALEAVKRQKEEAVAELAVKAAECGFVDVKCELGNFALTMWEKVKATLAPIGIAVQAWLTGVILLVMGMAAAAYILFNVERVAMGFIGGFVASGVRGMLGLVGGGGLFGSKPQPGLAGTPAPSTALVKAGGGGGPQAGGGGEPPAQTIYPRPVVYDMQPYYGGGYRSRGEVINVEWQQVSGRELPTPSAPRALPPSSGPRGLPPSSSES